MLFVGPDRSPPPRHSTNEFDIQQAYQTLKSLRPMILLLDLAYILFVWKGARLLADLKVNRATLRQVSIGWNGFNAMTSLFMFFSLLPELLTSFSNGEFSRINTFGHYWYVFFSWLMCFKEIMKFIFGIMFRLK